MDPHAIARKVLDGTEITTDEVRALAVEVVRLRAQRGLDDHGIAPPPGDREALRRSVESDVEEGD